MKTKFGVVLLTLVSAIGFAQTPPPAPGGPTWVQRDGPGGNKQVMVFRREMGAWWKNSKIAEKLNLTDSQIKQLEDAFYQHRLKLVDMGAAMEKADMKLNQMLDADTVDESAVNAQVDQVLAARGQMEREFTNMNLNFRKILTLDQWKQLRSMHGETQDRMFFRHAVPPGMGAGPASGPQSDLAPDGISFPPTDGADCTTSEKNGLKIVECTKKITIMNDTEHEL